MYIHIELRCLICWVCKSIKNPVFHVKFSIQLETYLNFVNNTLSSYSTMQYIWTIYFINKINNGYWTFLYLKPYIFRFYFMDGIHLGVHSLTFHMHLKCSIWYYLWEARNVSINSYFKTVIHAIVADRQAFDIFIK